MKNGESIQLAPFCALYGGKVRKAKGLQVVCVWAFLGGGLLLTGCKTAPELTEANAQALIQAKYDQTPPVGVNIIVDDLGMRMGATDKYWDRTKVYPNRFWADFALTPEGKKAIKLPNGGDVIQWRPESADDTHYSVMVVTTAANHLRAHDLNNLQDEPLPGSDTVKGADYTEGADLTGVPAPLQDIAHNPGNRLSAKRHADFSFEGGTWKLHSIE